MDLKTIFIKGCLSLAIIAGLSAQTGSVTGSVTDENGNPLSGANIVIEGTSSGAAAANDGSYIIKNVPTGSHTISASMIGYGKRTETIRVSDGSVQLDFVLGQVSLPGEEVVVSASRRMEKIVDAPVTIAVINEAKIRRSTGFNVGALMKEVKGADIYQAGIQGIGVNARGFMSAYSYRFMMMGDGMNAMLPGAGLSSGGL